MWVLVLAAIAAVAYWLFRQGGPMSSEAPRGGSGSGALDILKERYARGEITREEFERMRQDIEGGE